jgi:glycosyltransferase involved in cell wall biosynthesis
MALGRSAQAQAGRRKNEMTRRTDVAIIYVEETTYVGGAELVILNLAWGIADRGLNVDLLVMERVKGIYREYLHPNIRVVPLSTRTMRAAVPSLAGYLRRERPATLLAAKDYINVAAILAKLLARTHTHLVTGTHTNLSASMGSTQNWRYRLLPILARLLYPRADAMVAVSGSAADDLATSAHLPRERIRVVHNPVVTPSLLEKAQAPLNHPWFAAGEPPVVLSAARLHPQKDLPTLIRAFTIVQSRRPARLLILGEGSERPALEALISKISLEDSAALPGFIPNPYPYMAHAGVFAFSSAREGLPTVLIEALACGTPVVSTDCPSGPAEILQNGRYGKLVPVGDVDAIAAAIIETLDAPPDPDLLRQRAQDFSLERSVDQYLEVLELQPPASTSR